jgi:hypothetical protein
MLMYTSLQDSSQMVGVLLPHDCRSCSDNPNKEFADCSIPQEKSDAEINRELEISENSLCDEEDDTDATGDKPMEDCIQENRPAVWTLIPHNIFNHRSRKHQDPDEVSLHLILAPAVAPYQSIGRTRSYGWILLFFTVSDGVTVYFKWTTGNGLSM